MTTPLDAMTAPAGDPAAPDPDRGLLLRMTGVTKRFPGVVALDDVQLEVHAGEVLVLLGENGAGKSTLMKILGGAYHADAGKVELKGHEVRINSPRDALDLGIAVIYQEFNLVSQLTVMENVFMGREPRIPGRPGVIDWARMRRETAAILAELDLPIDPGHQVGRLGVAQQQMVEIARSVSAGADIVVMDEPTSALTNHEIIQLFRVVKQLQARGAGVIYISHRLEEVPEVGTRVSVLRDGHYVGSLPASSPVQEFIRLMVGRDLTKQYPKEPVAFGEEVLRVEHLERKGVLHDASFSVRAGEILGVAGLVGAGRTELVRAIFGADHVDSGRIVVDGKEVRVKSPGDAIRARIGLLPEDRKTQGLVLLLSIAENISMASPGGVSRAGVLNLRAVAARAQQFVESLRIRTPSIFRPARSLSGGTQQKVVLAKWLASRSRVLIFDEPTRGIDVGAKVEVYQLMMTLVKQGAAIVMVSSELPEVLGMSDRVLVMRGGRIVAEVTGDDMNQERILAAAMGQGNDVAA
jgi:ribose transport system ATP-binding protein